MCIYIYIYIYIYNLSCTWSSSFPPKSALVVSSLILLYKVTKQPTLEEFIIFLQSRQKNIVQGLQTILSAADFSGSLCQTKKGKISLKFLFLSYSFFQYIQWISIYTILPNLGNIV